MIVQLGSGVMTMKFESHEDFDWFQQHINEMFMQVHGRNFTFPLALVVPDKTVQGPALEMVIEERNLRMENSQVFICGARRIK